MFEMWLDNRLSEKSDPLSICDWILIYVEVLFVMNISYMILFYMLQL